MTDQPPAYPPQGDPSYPAGQQSGYQPGYQPGYPPTGGGYEKPGPKVTVTWVGFLLALGGLLTAVGCFLQFEKVSFSGGSYAFTGIGTETTTGQFDASLFEPGGAGKTLLAFGVLVLLGGILVVLRQGRLWVSIVALVLSAIGVVLGLAAIGAASSDADDLSGRAGVHITGSVGIGAVLALVGMVIGLIFSIVGIVVRRRSN